eukprot:COSAG04_NODE_967_length_9131_cov_7.105957_2_plen_92_part_00
MKPWSFVWWSAPSRILALPAKKRKEKGKAPKTEADNETVVVRCPRLPVLMASEELNAAVLYLLVFQTYSITPHHRRPSPGAPRAAEAVSRG